MMNQLKMIELVLMRLRSVPVSREKLVLGYPEMGQPQATQKWVSLFLTRYSGQPLATMNWGVIQKSELNTVRLVLRCVIFC
jgi:hypothetical protein